MASIRIIMRRCMGIGKKEASIADLLACYIFDCPQLVLKSSRLYLNFSDARELASSKRLDLISNMLHNNS